MSQARENMPGHPCCCSPGRQRAHLWGGGLGTQPWIDRRTTQEKEWEGENSTSHASYRTATAEWLVEEAKRQTQGKTWWFSKWLWTLFLRVTYPYRDGGTEYLEADVFEITGKSTAFLPSTKQSHAITSAQLSFWSHCTALRRLHRCISLGGGNVSIATLLPHVNPTLEVPDNLHSAV